jgi:thioredoxin 1
MIATSLEHRKYTQVREEEIKMSITIATNENYDTLLKTGSNIVDFYSTTCVPCKMFSKILEELSYEYPFVNIIKVNITDYPKLGYQNNIEAVPTILFFKDGKELEKSVGVMSADEVTERISQYYYE